MSPGGVGKPSRKGAVQLEPVWKAGLKGRSSWVVRSMVGVVVPRIEENCEPSVGRDIGTEEQLAVERRVDTCGMVGSVTGERTGKRAERDSVSHVPKQA